MSVEMATNQELIMALRPLEVDVPGLERNAWLWYAKERWPLGEAKERAVRRAFERRIAAAWLCMSAEAAKRKQRIQFSLVRLRYLAVMCCARACPWCTKLFGIESMGLAWDEPPTREAAGAWALGNVVVCCELCAQAKGSLSGREWLNVVGELRACEAVAASEAVAAMAAGRQVMGKLKGKRYSPGRPGRG